MFRVLIPQPTWRGPSRRHFAVKGTGEHRSLVLENCDPGHEHQSASLGLRPDDPSGCHFSLAGPSHLDPPKLVEVDAAMNQLSVNRNQNDTPLVGNQLMAERELAAFFNAVTTLFGSEQATITANDWLERLERMTDLPASPREWRQLSIEVTGKLAKRSSSCLQRVSPAHLLAIQAEVPLRSSARNPAGRSRLACESARCTSAPTKSGP